jgi:hypothetical protein
VNPVFQEAGAHSFMSSRPNSAQSRALEKKGPGENKGTFYAIGAVHSRVSECRPLFESFAAPIGRRIVLLKGGGRASGIRTLGTSIPADWCQCACSAKEGGQDDSAR